MRARPVLAALAAAALALGLASPTVAAPDGRSRPELPAAASDRARQALADVRAIFEGDRPGAGRASANAGRDATLALRDLMRVRGELTGADRRAANAYLARPTDGASDPMGDGYAASTDPQQTCTSTVCVHWVDTSADRPSQVDTDGDTIPDFVETTLATVTSVHATYVDAGYRPPKPDGTNGGDPRTDVYLANIGDQALYGYCTSDDPSSATRFDVWAYCVLDNDYAEFSTNTPVENMQVTAAHEYFHAVQFAYDGGEDGWFMEATATWAEDEVFDDVNDNVQYLPSGPLGKPWVPLDRSTSPHWYGDWVFFRYLTERFPAETGGLPNLVRDAWRYADDAPRGPRQYSLQAVKSALADQGASFRRTFAKFADANRRARSVYDEGATNRYPITPLWRTDRLTPSDSGTTWRTVRLDHLSSATARYVPSATMTSNKWRLRIRVDLAPTRRGSQAMVTVRERGGGVSTSPVTLTSDGDGSLRVPFDRDLVSAVELTVVNASDRTRCWQYIGPAYSCYGLPSDDGLAARVRGVASR